MQLKAVAANDVGRGNQPGQLRLPLRTVGISVGTCVELYGLSAQRSRVFQLSRVGIQKQTYQNPGISKSIDGSSGSVTMLNHV
jgi:hypothetical protein